MFADHPLCETRSHVAPPNGKPDRRTIEVGEVWENPVTGERATPLFRAIIVVNRWPSPQALNSDPMRSSSRWARAEWAKCIALATRA